MDSIELKIYNIVGSQLCVEAEDGQKVYDFIKKGLNEGKRIVLSFQNVEMITTAFLNTAVGQLYRDYPEEQIKSSLEVINLEPDDAQRIKRVTDTAKAFYKDRDKQLRKSIDDILGEGDDE
ncbi:MAG: STAS-like domain-containing protein [Candidatus Delongbacteria bacterium]|jgi:Icc-related predicted phosphoesterase|nr:STAS-like domain-containing protein [Candidatus Delongbacteria bacterium]